MKQEGKLSTREEIAEQLIVYINTHKLSPHSKLPSERELAEAWKVNRSTLRAALRYLQERGYIYSVPSKGYFVRAKKFIRNLQDLRPMHARAEEQGKTITTVLLKQLTASRAPKIAQKFYPTSPPPLLELVRLRYVDKEPAMLEYSYLSLDKCPGLEDIDLSTCSLYETLEKQYNLIPGRGMQNLSITGLNHTEAILFGKPLGTPVLLIEGLTYAQDEDQPFEFFKSIVRDDLVRFTCNLCIKQET
ncbi:MAG: GntR family transcriptional regulator [Clostridiales bacterium]|nr:GntR family transcriptional regulator [Clostridiales bacterium]